MEYASGENNSLGINFGIYAGRITLFKGTIMALGHPEFYRFLFDPDSRQFAVQCCSIDASGANQLPRQLHRDRYETYSLDLVKYIYYICGWDADSSYRVIGTALPESRMIVFDLNQALRVIERRIPEKAAAKNETANVQQPAS